MGNTTNKQTPQQIKKIIKSTPENGTSRLTPIRKAMDYFERKLDSKRRLTIPTELRNEFASGTVVTRGFKDYLHMYPQQVWDREVEPSLQGSILDEQVADLNVRFRRGKISADLDQKQGRVTIEQHLLDYAGIDKSMVAVRVGSYWRLMRPDAEI